MIYILSIITNFGCDTGCKYCIWKNHILSKYKTTYENTNWKLLKKHISNISKDRISVSGGGDPLFNYNCNQKWWNNLYNICKETNTKIDLHTSKLIKDINIINKYNKYVLHMTYEKFINAKFDIQWLSDVIKLRLVFVVTKDFKEEYIYELEKFCRQFNIQLSFRQLVLDNKSQYILEDILDNEHAYWKYIKQADYNIYFMPNNKIYYEYLIREE